MYVTTEEDLEDGHTIRPDDSDLKLFTFQSFLHQEQQEIEKQIKERRSTKTIYSKNKETVTKNDFVLHKMLGRGAHGKVVLCSRRSNP